MSVLPAYFLCTTCMQQQTYWRLLCGKDREQTILRDNTWFSVPWPWRERCSQSAEDILRQSSSLLPMGERLCRAVGRGEAVVRKVLLLKQGVIGRHPRWDTGALENTIPEHLGWHKMTLVKCWREKHDRSLGHPDGREFENKMRPLGLIVSRKVFPEIAH